MKAHQSIHPDRYQSVCRPCTSTTTLRQCHAPVPRVDLSAAAVCGGVGQSGSRPLVRASKPRPGPWFSRRRATQGGRDFSRCIARSLSGRTSFALPGHFPPAARGRVRDDAATDLGSAAYSIRKGETVSYGAQSDGGLSLPSMFMVRTVGCRSHRMTRLATLGDGPTDGAVLLAATVKPLRRPWWKHLAPDEDRVRPGHGVVLSKPIFHPKAGRVTFLPFSRHDGSDHDCGGGAGRRRGT